jgi:hypothetical protein
MPSIFHEYSTSNDWIALGNLDVRAVKTIHGMEELPSGIDGKHLLTTELPTIPIVAAGVEVAWREFYLCYSARHSFLFIVETEMAKLSRPSYRAQYGANDNYDNYEEMHREVWIYRPDSPRAKDPVIANHLKPYLPQPTE